MLLLLNENANEQRRRNAKSRHVRRGRESIARGVRGWALGEAYGV
jgi:hypothetical protein